MKNRLIILIITMCIVFQLARLESYVSTANREQEERLGSGAERHAQITTRSESLERGNLYNAQVTEQAEIDERYRGLNNAQITTEKEKLQRSGRFDDAQLTTRAQDWENSGRVKSAQITSQRKQESRATNNASLTERMEKQAREDSH
jgi:hypothetical protein